MPNIVPNSTPRLNIDRVLPHVIRGGAMVQLIGIRGYYRNTMGKPGENDIGIYDDAICIVSPNVFATFNANTDPSRLKQNVAILEPGKYWYKLGIHGITKPKERRYEALVQDSPVEVARFGWADTDIGWFGINIHRGGYNTTSSEGCQTIYPTQWESFILLVKAELKRMNQIRLMYILVNNEGEY